MSKIKLLIMDVDGTLTDGLIYMGQDGEVMKAFCARDGYGIKHILPALDIVPVILTGRVSSIVENRAGELGITEIHQGVNDKLTRLKEIAAQFDAVPEEIAYIGDDLNDLECMQYCGLTACPADAADGIKDIVDYICPNKGGSGAARDFTEYLQYQLNPES